MFMGVKIVQQGCYCPQSSDSEALWNTSILTYPAGVVFQQDSEPTFKGALSWLKCNRLLWLHLLAARLEHLKCGVKRQQQAVGP